MAKGVCPAYDCANLARVWHTQAGLSSSHGEKYVNDCGLAGCCRLGLGHQVVPHPIHNQKSILVRTEGFAWLVNQLPALGIAGPEQLPIQRGEGIGVEDLQVLVAVTP